MIDALRRYADGRRARREALAHLPGDFGPPVLGGDKDSNAVRRSSIAELRPSGS
jgi:hypothetical protein